MHQSNNVAQVANRHSTYAKISNLLSGSRKILDVGCGAGPLCRVLRQRNKRVEIVGIDKNVTLLGDAKLCYDRIIQMDLDCFEGIPDSEGYFDAIVLADVLEHLKEPQQVLVDIKSYLAPHGIIVVSLPNIARIEIRLRLLLGKFDYTASGILDKTHLHFYTHSAARSLVENAGYAIHKVEYTGLGSRLKALPNLFAYQFIIAAKPSTFA